mmetsp:Transcript_2609/g.6187  ORF Transcript_2609/g.6187 Transcript_2609/m.6187 type:complete len:110 (-) Transcript_2609:22-351(-)
MYPHYVALLNLEHVRAEIFRDEDAEALESKDVNAVTSALAKAVDSFDRGFNPVFGSRFRRGLKDTFFGMQMGRYADLYAVSYRNLLYYPPNYHFCGSAALLPHETAVAQ